MPFCMGCLAAADLLTTFSQKSINRERESYRKTAGWEVFQVDERAEKKPSCENLLGTLRDQQEDLAIFRTMPVNLNVIKHYLGSIYCFYKEVSYLCCG